MRRPRWPGEAPIAAGVARRGALITAALLLAGSCPNDFVESVAGDYVLESVDGEPLPVPADGSGELTAGSLRFGSDHSCDRRLTYTGGVDTDTCSWIRNGPTLSVTWSDDQLAFMTYIDGEVTWMLGGRDFLFRR